MKDIAYVFISALCFQSLPGGKKQKRKEKKEKARSVLIKCALAQFPSLAPGVLALSHLPLGPSG